MERKRKINPLKTKVAMEKVKKKKKKLSTDYICIITIYFINLKNNKQIENSLINLD